MAISDFKRDVVGNARRIGISDSKILPLLEEQYNALIVIASNLETDNKRANREYLKLKRALQKIKIAK